MTYNSVTKETLQHLAYSSDQASSDCHLFPALKQNIEGHSYENGGY
jgi:hypothetical protein